MGEKELAAGSSELMPGARAIAPAGATASAPPDAPRMAVPGGGDGGVPEPEETAIVKSKSNITNN